MHLTLHLTDRCNLACRYCYVRQGARTMTPAVARAAVDLAAREGRPAGLVFFGGEPLLCRDLIMETVAYAEEVRSRTGQPFYYKITTNGTLLDEAFLEFSRRHTMVVGFSHDGLMQDDGRVFPDGRPTAALLQEKIPLLLRYQPYAIAMTTVNPWAVERFADSVEWLFGQGFRYLVTTPNYAQDAGWTDASLRELERQYRRLASLYVRWSLREEKFYLGAFEMKIRSHLRGGEYCHDRCQLGRKQISVAPDGSLYPCVQFVDDQAYRIGDVWQGMDEERRAAVEKLGAAVPPGCATCAVRGRCNYTCGCLNKQATGSAAQVSPVQCRHERMLLPIADSLAERLYKKRDAAFLQKQYNEWYPILSMVEDRI